MPGATTCQAPHHPASLWQARKGLFCPIYTARPRYRNAPPTFSELPGQKLLPHLTSMAQDAAASLSATSQRGDPCPWGWLVAKAPTLTVQHQDEQDPWLADPPFSAYLSKSFSIQYWSLDPQFPRKLVGRLFFTRVTDSSTCSLLFLTVLALQEENLKKTSPEP